MKNKIKWLGIIAFLAVIGLFFTACGGSEPEKTIIITGIPAEYLTASYYLFVDGADGKCLALGNGKLSGSTVTGDMYITEWAADGRSYRMGSDRWTGKGSFVAGVNIMTIDGNFKTFKARNTNITNAVTTIPFSQLQLQ
jgi:hypothetical protein